MEAEMPRGNPLGNKTPKAAGNDMPGKRADLPVDTLGRAFFGRTGDEQRQPSRQELAKHAKAQGAVNEKKS
jgi:hypothetical protein